MSDWDFLLKPLEPRFVVRPLRGWWFGVWDNELSHWTDDRRWLQPAIAQSSANILNREHES